MKYSEIIGNRIWQLCKIRNYNIADVSRRSGLPYKTIDDIVNNRVKDIKLSTLCLISYAFEMKLTTFIDIPELNRLSHEELKALHQKRNTAK